jgi:hypothetical protein
MTATEIRTERPVLPVLRGAFFTPWLLLTIYPFLSLFLLTGAVDQLFPWTVASPLTAATLGAAYGSAIVFFTVGLLAPTWSEARLLVYASLLQLSLMLAASLAHAGQLHLLGGPIFAFTSSWVWLASHLVAPPLLLVLLVVQLRSRGSDRPRPEPMPAYVGLPAGLLGGVIGAAGLGLYLVPALAGQFWPWPIDGLDAQALGSWLITFGAASLLALREADLYRIWGGLAAYAVFGLLALVALARYSGDLRPGSPGAWVYGAVLVLVALDGAGGILLAGPPTRLLAALAED